MYICTCICKAVSICLCTCTVYVNTKSPYSTVILSTCKFISAILTVVLTVNGVYVN